MNRIELIQEIFNKSNFKNYVEIGSQRGYSFLRIKCRNKIAVDPKFIISITKKIKWLFRNPYNIRNKYFEETSDDFFHKRKHYLKSKEKIDVFLIDGLHTFETSLNDVLNALKFLNNKGVIVMHDCLPPNNAAALPTKQFPNEEEQKIDGWAGEWCGDVWKSIAYLRKKLPDSLEVMVLNTDYGLGIVRVKGEINKDLKIDEKLFQEIDKMTYEEMIPNAKSLLDLQHVDYSKTLIAEISNNVNPDLN